MQPSFQVINKDIKQQEPWLNAYVGVLVIIPVLKNERLA